jgi:hypothetical protein
MQLDRAGCHSADHADPGDHSIVVARDDGMECFAEDADCVPLGRHAVGLRVVSGRHGPEYS